MVLFEFLIDPQGISFFIYMKYYEVILFDICIYVTYLFNSLNPDSMTQSRVKPKSSVDLTISFRSIPQKTPYSPAA